MQNTVIILPPWMTGIELCRPRAGVRVVIGVPDVPTVANADRVIAFSMGALAVLERAGDIGGKIVLVNPPLPHRGLFAWLVRWLRFAFREGAFSRRQRVLKDPLRFLRAFGAGLRLLRRDLGPVIAALPREKLLIVRGSSDDFFFDKSATALFRSRGIAVHEVPGGHNWSAAIEDAAFA